ncbi:hypothetical protein DTW90_34100 [Neorhizobium sp. P12A]|uniref:hypothetical protein n=1 Tax=Neorhizobium sp. P12A TaxID=2268027 RepID=UPI0011EE6B10|nr:hypothetical protein [Neorhizobium sp. P12A]KAA0686469.1 hypothetical protein DTW90_34100 [Neorhizobium sp. P12A]
MTEIGAYFSVDHVRSVLDGDPSAIYTTARGTTVGAQGMVRHKVGVTNADLISIFESISNDNLLIEGILEEARLDDIELAGGALSSSRLFPFSREMQMHLGGLGQPIPDIVALELRSAICSFVVHRFGNHSI